MTTKQKQAYEWAKNQSYQSVAARYAKELCRVIEALQSENAEKDEEIRCMRHNVAAMKATLDQQAKNCEGLLAEKDEHISRVEAERDAANGYLEKIEGMFGTAYPNEILAVLEEWRGAQGEA